MFDTRKIGMKIAALRKAKDMTQLELADKMMVSYQAVSNWERGNSLPDISKLEICLNTLIKRHESLRTYFEVVDIIKPMKRLNRIGFRRVYREG